MEPNHQLCSHFTKYNSPREVLYTDPPALYQDHASESSSSKHCSRPPVQQKVVPTEKEFVELVSSIIVTFLHIVRRSAAVAPQTGGVKEARVNDGDAQTSTKPIERRFGRDISTDSTSTRRCETSHVNSHHCTQGRPFT